MCPIICDHGCTGCFFQPQVYNETAPGWRQNGGKSNILGAHDDLYHIFHLLGQKSGFLSERLHRELPRTCCQAPRPSSASKPLFPCIFPAFFHIFNNLDLSIQIWALGKGTLRFKILCHLNHRCCSNNTIYVAQWWVRGICIGVVGNLAQKQS